MADLTIIQNVAMTTLPPPQSSRGSQQEVRYIGPSRVMLRYHLPLAEVIVDFYSKLKSLSSGYARWAGWGGVGMSVQGFTLPFISGSFDYEESGHAPADLVKVTQTDMMSRASLR